MKHSPTRLSKEVGVDEYVGGDDHTGVNEVSNVECPFSTVLTVYMHHFEDRLGVTIVNVVSKSVYHDSNVLCLGVASNPIVTIASMP